MIIRASLQHAEVLSELGKETFYNAHKDSAPAHEIDAYLKKLYSTDAVKKDLADPANIYHLISHGSSVAGFSKMVLNLNHNATGIVNVSKMEQIYLLHPFHGLKLGAELLGYNIDYSKSCGQHGMWLVVWVGNTTAIEFYKKFGFYIVTRDEFQLTETHLSPCYIMFLKY